MQKAGERIFDLLKKEDFVLWVVNPREESNHYWSKWMTANPDRQRDVELARQFILSSQKRIVEKMPPEGYNHVLEKIVSHARKRKDNQKSINFWRPLSLAASITLLLFAFIYVLWEPYLAGDSEVVATTKAQREAPLGRKITTRLPDGSIVTLNSGSRITFPDQFDSDIREVTLSGEAFFEIEHNPDKPFYVRMNGDNVRVWGTSFNIRSYPEDNIVQVAVATGRVSYAIPSGEEVTLLPGQMATYLPQKNRLSTGKVDELQAFGWKEKVLYFKSMPFDKLTKELERWYGVEIIAMDNFGARGTYSGEFRNATLSEVLYSLSFVYRFDFKIEGTKVTLNKITL